MSKRSITVAEYVQLLRNLGKPIPSDLLPATVKPNKYFAKKVKLHGFIFDSKIEASVYMELRYQLCAGIISDLWIHTRFPLITPCFENNVIVGYDVDEYYEDDFDYIVVKTQEWKVIDVKSKFTVTLKPYQRKKERMLRQYGISICEEIR